MFLVARSDTLRLRHARRCVLQAALSAEGSHGPLPSLSPLPRLRLLQLHSYDYQSAEWQACVWNHQPV